MSTLEIQIANVQAQILSAETETHKKNLVRKLKALEKKQQMALTTIDSQKTGGHEECGEYRKSMEDRQCIFVHEGHIYLAVFDGHGGAKVAELAKKHLHEFIPTPKSLFDGFRVFDKEHCSDIYSEGSTAVVAFVNKKYVYVANAGDSEAVIGIQREDGKIEHKALTVKHNPTRATVDGEAEIKRIDYRGGYCQNGRVWGSSYQLAVSRSFGDKYFDGHVIPDPHTATLKLEPEHKFIVLASDGLFGDATYEEVVNIVFRKRQKGYSPEEIAKRLINFAFYKESKDNVSVIVHFF